MIKTIILNSDVTPKIKPATSRIYIYDVSGSMYGSLQKMKDHLKEKLLNEVPENDDISILYFSGKGQYGIVAEGINVSQTKNLKTLYQKIDKLQTIGLTGFVEPLREVSELIARLPSANLKEMFFLTDGYDNQWSEKEILQECSKLKGLIDNAYIVEYGWYCNRPLLEKMTDVLSAVHLFSEDYEMYEQIAEKAIGEGISKKVKVKLPAASRDNVAFYQYNNNISIVVADDEGHIMVPEDLPEYYFIEQGAFEEKVQPGKEIYMALYVLASRKDSSGVYELLKALGDVRFIKQYVNTFGKQDLTKFLDEVTVAVSNESARMSQGCDYNLVPKEDAYNVLEMLQDLMQDGNSLYPDHPDFQYKRIGRAKETVSVAERLEKAKQALTEANDVEAMKEQTEKMMNLLNATDLKFEADPADNGVPISNLTWNEDRPNVSLLIRRTGQVKLPANKFNLEAVSTFIYRNYNIIKDGILNMNVLPVSLNKATFDKLQENGLLAEESFEDKKVYSLDFSSLPVINRKMVKTASATEVFGKQLDLETIKAHNKVFSFYLKELEPKTSVGWKTAYGDEAVSWLAEMGLTEYNGFAPKVKSAESTDFYIGKSLEIKVKGLSSLPKVSEVEDKLKNKKALTIKDKAMAQAIEQYQALGDVSNEEKITFLKQRLEDLKKAIKPVSLQLSKIKFATIIGQVWFKEFANEEDSTLALEYLGASVEVSAVLKDIEVKI